MIVYTRVEILGAIQGLSLVDGLFSSQHVLAVIVVGVALMAIVAQIKKRKSSHPSEQEKEKQKALLTICAWCKSYRDSSGKWHSNYELYKRNHPNTPTTHGICPTCRTKFDNEIANLPPPD